MKAALSLLVCLLLVVPAADAQSHRRRHRGGSGGLSGKLARVRQKKASIQREIRKTAAQKQWVVTDINHIDNRLSTVQDQLEDTTARLSDNRRTQAELAQDLIETTHRLGVTREQLRHRLKAIYEEGDSSYFEVLAGAESFGDLAVRTDMLQNIAEQDRKLLDRYVSLKKRVADRKQRQDRVVREIGRLVTNQKNQQVELRDARHDKQDALSNLTAKQGQLQAMLRQFEQDEAAIASEIQAYIRRMAAIKRMMKKKIHRGGRVVEIEVPAPPLVFNGRFSRPVNARITSGFGMRYHPVLHITRLHAGIDFGASYGTAIHSAADGYVISASYMRGYGNCVIIDHGGGISTVYAHASRVFVRSGQKVSRGQAIAAVGATGLATGPHLHFEVRVNGRPVNPLGRL